MEKAFVRLIASFIAFIARVSVNCTLYYFVIETKIMLLIDFITENGMFFNEAI